MYRYHPRPLNTGGAAGGVCLRVGDSRNNNGITKEYTCLRAADDDGAGARSRSSSPSIHPAPFLRAGRSLSYNSTETPQFTKGEHLSPPPLLHSGLQLTASLLPLRTTTRSSASAGYVSSTSSRAYVLLRRLGARRRSVAHQQVR